jgi:CRP-like cAMP-binding protein
MAHTHDKLKLKVQGIAPLSAEDLDSFCEAATPIECKKGHLLLKEGVVCKSIYFVESGYLRSYYTLDGLEINTGLHFENTFVTNLKSLRMELPSDSFIVAAEPVVLYEFTKEKMMALYARCAPVVAFGKKLLELLAIEQQEHISLFQLYSAEERFRHIQKTRPEIFQRVPLSYLASYLGVARETLSRFRKK